MSWLPSFAQRIYLPEQMDAPDCDGEMLRRTYAQLAIINRLLSRMRGLLEREILDDLKARGGGQVTIAELGCGGGDMLAWLAKRCERRGLGVQLVGVDSEARAVARAQRRLSRFSNARVVQGSVAQLEAARPDYVYCNHVLHHIPPADVVPVLQRLHACARRRLLVNDLERSPWAYVLYTVLAALAFHRSFVFSDGRLSIRKGFVVTELQEACEAAHLPSGFVVSRVRPWRVVVNAPAANL